MKSSRILSIVAVGFAIILLSCTGRQERSAVTKDTDQMKKSTTVVKSLTTISDSTIPQSILRSAEGIAVIPGLIKAALGVGGQYGRGVMSVRRPAGAWSYPSFITMTGGSFGIQLGGESIDLVLVFRTSKSVLQAQNGQITLGADASVAAGPVGRHASAGVNTQLNAEVLSYARAKGLFAGVSLGGARLAVDDNANAVFYRSDSATAPRIFGDSVRNVPDAAIKFVDEITAASR